MKVGADNLDPGPEGRRAFALIAATGEHAGTLPASVGGQLLSGPRFTNTRLAHQQHEAPAVCESGFEARAEGRHFALTPDENAIRERRRIMHASLSVSRRRMERGE